MKGISENLVGVFTTDADMRVRSWDPVMERMTGRRSRDVVGDPLVEVVPDISSRGLLGRFERALKEGTIEILAAALHGRLIPCSPQTSSSYFQEMQQHVRIAAFTENAMVSGLMVTVEDVTARMEQKMDLASKLKDPDKSVRLAAARGVSEGEDTLLPELTDLIINALGDPDWRVRRRLTEAMSRRAAPDAVGALLAALKEKHLDFGTVNSALQILRSTHVATIETLIDFLKSHDSDLRIQAALALGEQNHPAIVPALLAGLGDEDVNVRYHVIEALGKQKAVSAIDALLEIAEQKDFFLSFAALEALGTIGSPIDEMRVAAFLEDDIFWEPAARALARAGSPESAGYLVKLFAASPVRAGVAAELLDHLIDRHSDQLTPPGQIRREIVGELSAVGIKNFLGALENRIDTELPGLCRLAGFIPDVRVIDALARFMDDPNLIEPASAALVAHGDTAAGPLSAKLTSEDDQVVCLSAQSLGQIGAESAVDDLIIVLDRGGDCLRAASRALGMIGGEKALSTLMELADSNDPELQRAGMQGLSELKRETAESRLTELLSHPNPNIRRSAIELCGNMPAARGRGEAIAALCLDEDNGVRKAAIKNLRAVAGDGGVPHVVRALKDNAPEVRAAAAAALAEYKSLELGAAFGEALEDVDPWTRYYAVRGLAKLQDASFVERVRGIALNDPAEHVRLAAGELLREQGFASEPGA